MANVVTTNPLVLDSTGSVSTSRVFIKSIVWYGGAAADSLRLLDASGGNAIFGADVVTGGETTKAWSPATPVEAPGLYVATLDGGVALVYLA